jgi:NADH pyrophosphatase NudC (nudix superfamily)
VPDGELESARWFTREEILDGSALLPGPVSIAYRLIMGWARPASPTG